MPAAKRSTESRPGPVHPPCRVDVADAVTVHETTLSDQSPAPVDARRRPARNGRHIRRGRRARVGRRVLVDGSEERSPLQDRSSALTSWSARNESTGAVAAQSREAGSSWSRNADRASTCSLCRHAAPRDDVMIKNARTVPVAPRPRREVLPIARQPQLREPRPVGGAGYLVEIMVLEGAGHELFEWVAGRRVVAAAPRFAHLSPFSACPRAETADDHLACLGAAQASPGRSGLQYAVHSSVARTTQRHEVVEALAAEAVVTAMVEVAILERPGFSTRRTSGFDSGDSEQRFRASVTRRLSHARLVIQVSYRCRRTTRSRDQGREGRGSRILRRRTLEKLSRRRQTHRRRVGLSTVEASS